MKHNVYLGDFAIYGVSDLSISNGRDIKVYDGLGAGMFPVPDSQDLQEVTISSELTEQNDHHMDRWECASDVFKGLKKMLGSSEPERLVITNGIDKMSILVLLKSYDRTERYPGVYDVTIKVIEYKKAQPRTIGIPTFTRPGKMPELPKTVVFNGKDSTPFKSAIAEMNRLKYTDHVSPSAVARMNQLRYTDPTTGKSYTNPCLVPDGKELIISSAPSTIELSESLKDKDLSWTPGESKPSFWQKKAQEAMEKANKEWREEQDRKINSLRYK